MQANACRLGTAWLVSLSRRVCLIKVRYRWQWITRAAFDVPSHSSQHTKPATSSAVALCFHCNHLPASSSIAGGTGAVDQSTDHVANQTVSLYRSSVLQLYRLLRVVTAPKHHGSLQPLSLLTAFEAPTLWGTSAHVTPFLPLV